jgi:hypothetical protein
MAQWSRQPVIYEVNTWVWLGELSRKSRTSAPGKLMCSEILSGWKVH